MKKVSMFLLAIMFFFTSVFNAGVSVYAVEEENSPEVESIEFTPAQPHEFIENQYGYWRTDSAGNDYFYYNYSVYEKGNQLTVNFKDGKSITYTYEDGFFDEEGNAIDKKYLDYDDNQREEHWTVDRENYITVSYAGYECKVPVTIVENPVNSIEFRPEQPYDFVENGYGYWMTDSAGNKYFLYDYSVNKEGNQLTVNYNDGKSITYTYTEDGFFDEEGNTIDKKYWDYDSKQYSEHWTIDSENYITVSYMGHECKIPVTIVESQVMSITAESTSKILEYSSNAMPTIILTVNYKDGQSKTFENVNDLSLIDEMRVDINKISLGEYEVIFAGAKTNLTAEVVNDIYVTDIDIKQIKTIDHVSIYDTAFMDCLECTVTFSDGTVSKCNGTSIDPAINHSGKIVVLGQYNLNIYVDSITQYVKNRSKIKFTVGDYEKDFVVDNSVHYHTYSQEITAPTCEEKGYTTYKCTGCDYSYKDDYVDANGHNYGSEWSKDGANHWHSCACGKKKDVAAHTFDAGKITKAATETADGVKAFTCTVCGATKTEKIPATGSSTPKVGTKLKDSAGKAVYKVTSADKSNLTVEYIAPINKKAKSVTIPATIKVNGITYKVTSIAGNAFKNNKKLTKATIGKNVTTIGEKAFYKCAELTKVTIPSKVSKIGKQAFYGCKKLKSITVKTTKLTGKNVGKQAFKGINAKATIKVPKSKLKVYKKLLKSKGVGSKAAIKK